MVKKFLVLSFGLLLSCLAPAVVPVDCLFNKEKSFSTMIDLTDTFNLVCKVGGEISLVKLLFVCHTHYRSSTGELLSTNLRF